MTTFTRAMCRRGLSCERLNVREALSCVAFHSEHPLEKLAALIGRTPRYLRKVCGHYADGQDLPLGLVIPLTLVTRDCGILDALEFEVGRVAVELPREPAARGCLLTHAIDLIQDAGAYLEQARLITEALRHGAQLADDDQRRLQRKAFELSASASRILALALGARERVALLPPLIL